MSDKQIMAQAGPTVDDRLAECKIPDIFYLSTLDQIRAMADPLRYQMCLLLSRPMTGAGLARSLNIARPNAHYHLKFLEGVGLVRPHSEDASSGIVEKYYVIVGRVLDFTRMMPRTDALIPDNVSPATVGAISDFLATMLEVSRYKTLHAIDQSAVRDGHYFDFESYLTGAQFAAVLARLETLREDIVHMTRANESAAGIRADLVQFHLTNYFIRTGPAKADGSDAVKPKRRRK